MPLPCSPLTPAGAGHPTARGASVLPPYPIRRSLQRRTISGLYHTASAPAVYASRRIALPAMPDTLAVGGEPLPRGSGTLWASVKVSAHDGLFLCIPLSQAYPVAHWLCLAQLVRSGFPPRPCRPHVFLSVRGASPRGWGANPATGQGKSPARWHGYGGGRWVAHNENLRSCGLLSMIFYSVARLSYRFINSS